MRRFLISFLLPTLFCLVPMAAAGLVALALPSDAMRFFLAHIQYMDMLILGLGSALFVVQIILCWRALRWHGAGFQQNIDRWVNHLAQAAEWFPMLGHLGTVGGIKAHITPQEIIQLYAPAITATGAGLFMAFINILPTWIVILGRDVIISLGGARPSGDAA